MGEPEKTVIQVLNIVIVYRCGQPGEFVYLPYSFLSPSNMSLMGQFISNQFSRLRYGVFDDLNSKVQTAQVGSRHYDLCKGISY